MFGADDEVYGCLSRQRVCDVREVNTCRRSASVSRRKPSASTSVTRPP
ncbi:hypothetical protein HSB1_46080 [Halogranum salarium B-1]|uniref:Uncharacterized protein n=1 Tax=Halogranum salarium B-1 TaxID=1210908 RepID=J3ET52_9EURY|nr:hypothetical protein HSB1_46080 [Halogranum salarium B-1]